MSSTIYLDFTRMSRERRSIGIWTQLRQWRLNILLRQGKRAVGEVRREKSQVITGGYGRWGDYGSYSAEFEFLKVQLEGVEKRIKELLREDEIRRIIGDAEKMQQRERCFGFSSSLAYYVLRIEGIALERMTGLAKDLDGIFLDIYNAIPKKTRENANDELLAAIYVQLFLRRQNRIPNMRGSDHLSDVMYSQLGNCLGLTLFDFIILSRFGFLVGTVKRVGHILPWVEVGGRRIFLENTAKDYSSVRVEGENARHFLSSGEAQEGGLIETVAAVFNNRGIAEMSLPDLEAAIALDPNDPMAYTNRAVLIASRAFSLKVVSIYPGFSDYPGFLEPSFEEKGGQQPRVMGYSVRESEKFIARAVSDLDRVIKQRPKFAGAYWNRGVLFNCLGESRSAENDFESAAKLNPFYGVLLAGRRISELQWWQY